MAIAGRVLPLYKGPYNPSETYDPLDQVFYNGSTYACKESSTGNLPTDDAYWQIVAQGTANASAGAFFGNCDSLGNVSNKTVTIPSVDNFVLKKGVIVGVAFNNTNTYSATAGNPVSLNVNNSGSYPIYFDGSSNPLGNSKVAFGEADYVHYYQFDGSNWVFIGRSGVQTAAQTPLGTAMNIEGTSQTTTEGALNGLNDYADDIDAVISENGAKNLNAYPYETTTKTQNGITFTDIGDGRVKVGGDSAQTASGKANFHCHNTTKLRLKNGYYKISGCPSGGSTSSYDLVLAYGLNGTTTYINDIGEGQTFTANGSTSSPEGYTDVVLTINIATSTEIPAGGIIFKPMITLADQPNSDYAHYVPYAKTNRELTADSFGERGSFTPSLLNCTATYSNRQGMYYRIGKLVFVAVSIRGNMSAANGYAQIDISNLPSHLKQFYIANAFILGSARMYSNVSDLKAVYANLQDSTISLRSGASVTATWQTGDIYLDIEIIYTIN